MLSTVTGKGPSRTFRYFIDINGKISENGFVSIDIVTTDMLEFRDAIDRARQGVRDIEAAKKSLAILTDEREELRTKIGTIEVAVDLIRDVRNQ